MGAKSCTTIVEDGLLSASNEAMVDIWNLQQDDASIYTTPHTAERFEASGVLHLTCPLALAMLTL